MCRVVVTLAVIVWALPACAQTPTVQGDPARGVEFLPRTLFHMTAERLSGDDPRLVWDTHFGGELDVVDYGRGRFTFVGDYEAILGEELRTFDPNQGSYILAGSASARARGVEFAAVFHHQSRHLSDRAKEEPVDWNMLGGRVRRRFLVGEATLDARADLRGVVQKSFVDYSWELDAAVRTVVTVGSHTDVTASGGVRYLAVDGRHDRGNQIGYRVEGGVRFTGRAGAIELFVAAERRIDPFPLETGTAQWASAGFRLLSRE
jgi:hypothetical protein